MPKWKKHIENTKMAKFQAHGIIFQNNFTHVCQFEFSDLQKILLESKVVLSSKFFNTIHFSFLKILTI